MSELTALQALAKGREEVPEYASSVLISTRTRKGKLCWWDYEFEAWVYEPDVHSEPQPLAADYKPVIGAACLLGAMGVAMKAELTEMSDSDTFYAHPDFFINESDRAAYPRGYVYRGGDVYADLRQISFPCQGHVDGIGFDRFDVSRITNITEVIAHLNDAHDPRAEEKQAGRLSKPAAADPWPEERIVEWLRSLGYNGHVDG